MEGEKIRILLIEDNPGDARLLRELLAAKDGASFDLEHEDRLSTALARLAQGDIDVILLDLSLPDSHGLDGLNKICAQTLEVPIVVLSGLSDEAVAIKAVQEGAQDYLVKGSVDSDSLVRSLHYAIERQRLRVALRESESRYRLLADNVADVIWTADLRGRINYVSPSVKNFLGYTVDETVKLEMKDILTSDSAEQAKRLIRDQIVLWNPWVKHTPLSLTLEHIRKDGSALWSEVRLSFLCNEKGIITGVLGVTREITERIKAEEALRDSQARYRLLADNAVDVIWTVDMKGRLTYISPSITRLLGYTVDEAMSTKLSKFFTPASAETANKLVKWEMAAGVEGSQESSRSVVLEHVRKDGSTIWTEVVISFLRDKQGRLTGIQGVTRDITERKKAEETLRQSEQRYRLLAENVKDVIWTVDMNLRLSYTSPSITQLTGYRHEEYVTKTLEEILTPASLEFVTNLFAEELALDDSGHSDLFRARTFEAELICKDGSTVPVEMKAAALRDADGRPIGVLGVSRDITEHKKMEQELLRLSDAVKTSTDSIVITDLEGNVIDVNEATLRIQGVESKADLIGLRMSDAIAPEEQERALKDLAEVVDKGHVTGVEYHILTRDGINVLVETSASVMRGKDGEPIGIVAVTRDITERKRMEEALKQSEHNYRVLFESPIDGMFVVDAETMKVVLANQTIARMFRFDSVENTIGVNPLELVHPDDRERVLCFFMEDMLGESIRKVHEFRAITKDGREIWLSGIGTKIEYEGRPANLSSIRDITERKMMEEDKRRLEEQLLLAGRLAAVGELAAGVAHELNNPIAAIQGYSQLLTGRNDLDETMKNDLGIIYREAQRAAKITQNLLSFARRHEPEKHPISINEVIENDLEMQAHHMKVNNIELEVELDPDLPKTMADFHQMQQVFMNIINNAEQAMLETHGKRRLLIKTQRSGKMVQITFADNGPGISEENLKRIFDPFFTTKEVGKGTGLGLSICYGLVEAHGGRIYARSKLGQGATVVVEMPIVSQNQLVAEAALLNPSSRGVKWNKPGE